MLNGIDVLETYLNKYKEIEENKEDGKKNLIRRIDRLLKTINERRYLVDLNEIQNIVSEYETVDVDNILNDIMLNVNRYNVYLMNKKVKFTIPVLDNDIPNEDLVIGLKDVLNYLEVKEEDLDKNLLKDLNNYVDLDNFENFAKTIKTSNDIDRVLFDKILDKNILTAILLHSDQECVNNIINVFKNNKANLNRVVNNIPYIFIKEKINEKCKYNVETYYDVFMENVKLLEKYKISFKNMMYHPVFFINDVNKNEEYIIKLIELGIKPSNVLEHIGSLLVLKSNLIFNNIDVLNFYNIEFTDDTNNNGYTILGMTNLDEKIDYYIENNSLKFDDNTKPLDYLDFIRGLIIRDGYLDWKKNNKCVIVDNASFRKANLTEESIKKVYEKHFILNVLDEKYLVNGNYDIDGNIVSKHRLLKNLNNYNGKGNAFEEAMKYKSNISNLDSVISIISGLEMSGNCVNISQRI